MTIYTETLSDDDIDRARIEAIETGHISPDRAADNAPFPYDPTEYDHEEEYDPDTDAYMSDVNAARYEDWFMGDIDR